MERQYRYMNNEICIKSQRVGYIMVIQYVDYYNSEQYSQPISKKKTKIDLVLPCKTLIRRRITCVTTLCHLQRRLRGKIDKHVARRLVFGQL